VFERFAEQARNVVVFAQEEARSLDHDYIGPEHLLLGLLRDPATVAAQVLSQAGLSIEAGRASLLAIVPRGEPIRGDQPLAMPFTASAKQALEGSLAAAMATHAKAIAPEHLLLGLLDTDEHVTSILAAHHIGVDDLRGAVRVRSGRDLRQLAALRLEVVDALVLALEHRDDIMAIASQAPTRDEAAVTLRERFSISPQAAQFILDLRVSSFTKEEQQRLVREQADLRAALGDRESDSP
jgi:ATP-dependent Clp protease ATP-binding subunit ClpA